MGGWGLVNPSFSRYMDFFKLDKTPNFVLIERLVMTVRSDEGTISLKVSTQSAQTLEGGGWVTQHGKTGTSRQ